MSSNTPRSPRRRSTIRDVARAAGVSVAVVSYSFNHPDRVADVTRERVLAAAASLGYVGGSPAARALRVGPTRVIALCARSLREPLLTHPRYLAVAQGAARACAEAGVGLLIAPPRDGVVDGVITIGPWDDEPPRVAWVTLGASEVDNSDADGAWTDDAGAVAAEHLARLGHRHLAVMGDPSSGHRADAVRRAWGDTGPIDDVDAHDDTPAAAAEAARAVCAMTPRPSAVIATSPTLALAMYEQARTVGIEVPGGMSILSLDDSDDTARADLTSVAVPYDALGAWAVAALIGLSPRSTTTMPTAPTVQLTKRSTTGAPTHPMDRVPRPSPPLDRST